jgi:hypothetical protein
MDVAKVDRGCCICCKCFRDILQEFVQNILSFTDVHCNRFDLNVAYVSHICFNIMFHLFQSSITASVFMLQVGSVLSGCCKCMLQKFYMLHSSVSCCTCSMLFGESRRARE